MYVTISSLHDKGEQNVKGLANQACPHLDTLSRRFVHIWNPKIVTCGSFYKEKFSVEGIKCLSITSQLESKNYAVSSLISCIRNESC